MSSFRTEVIVVRFLPWEHQMVERLADARELTMSDFVRTALGLEPEKDARMVETAIDRSRHLA
jgi:hypothetical protein